MRRLFYKYCISLITIFVMVSMPSYAYIYHSLPTGYTEVEYIQASKERYSISQVWTVPNNLQENYNYIFEFTPLSWEDYYYGLMIGGNNEGSAFPKYGIFKLDNGWGGMEKRFIIAFWNYNLETRRSSPGGNYRVYSGVRSRFQLHCKNYDSSQGAEIVVDNEGYATYTHTSIIKYISGYSVQTGVYDIPLFTTIDGNTASAALMQLHNFKVEDKNGKVIYDYVPCKRNSDSKVGLYDVVNGAFYYPSAFTLIAGPEIRNDSTKRTIHVAKAGTLSNLISESEKYTIEDLTLTGELNGADFRLLRDMAGCNYLGEETAGKLTVLDFSDAKIVAGGEKYVDTNSLPGWNGTFSYTVDKNDVLPQHVFHGCKFISVKISNKVTCIDKAAFYYCRDLTSITIPTSVTDIEDSAFRDCRSLNTIMIHNSVQSIGYAAFRDCRGLTSIIIPNSVVSIGEAAFRECSSLSSITIPNSVTSIGDYAFYNCSGLTFIASEIVKPFAISEDVFSNYSKPMLTVPSGTKYAYQSTTGWKKFTTIVEKEVNVSDIDLEVTISLSKDLYMNGGDEAKVTWAEMESMILSKIGDFGITKQEFANDYKLDVYGDYNNMPFIVPTSFNLANTDNPGTLYTKTWQAKRYYRKNGEAPELLAIAEAGNYSVAQDETTLNKWTLTDNHWGEVWYTPYDNFSGDLNWRVQTNELIWNFYPGDYNTDRTVYSPTVLGKEQAGTMNNAKYQKLIVMTDAKYTNQGTSQKAISTVVRFINKNTGRSLWVTLKVPEKHIFFAYGDVNRRVLSQWYDYKTGYKENTPDTIEVYATVPTPTSNNYATGITTRGFTKTLTECWLNQDINQAVVFHGYTSKFTKFTGGKSPVTFRFRPPQKDVNADFSAAADGSWTVPGASGTTWTVKLNKQDAPLEDQIIAIKKNGVAYGPTVICTLTKAGTIHWMGRTEGAVLSDNKALTPNKEDVNEPANDILNYIGMYDAKGNQQKNTYLSGQQDKTFAAYVEIQVANDYYTPLIGKNYFNVRFLRPINIWPTQISWDNASNTTQIYDIWRLINIRDWRSYAVVLDNQKQQLDDSNIIYEGKFVDGEKASVPYSFYNITNVYVERDAIKSDAYLEPAKRVIGDPSSLLSIDEIPALTGKNDGVVNWQYLKIMPVGTSKETAGKTAIGLPESTQSGDILAYTNNGGVVKPFHVYVPIKVVYSHGALKPWTQTVWAVIKINPTVGNE